MLRPLLVLAAFLAAPAHAALLRYEFTSQVDGVSDEVASLLGIGEGSIIRGGLLLDTEAPLTDLQCDLNDCGTSRYARATYDASNMLIWAMVGNRVLSGVGTNLLIQDALPQLPGWTDPMESWGLGATAFPTRIGELTATYMRLFLQHFDHQAFDGYGLVGPNLSDWNVLMMANARFNIEFSDQELGRLVLGSQLLSIGPVESVPEPETLALMATGLAAILLTRRRRA